jgi:hypothetical protein
MEKLVYDGPYANGVTVEGLGVFKHGVPRDVPDQIAAKLLEQGCFKRVKEDKKKEA